MALQLRNPARLDAVQREAIATLRRRHAATTRTGPHGGKRWN
ncbi:hypothetical protein [Azohydromonas lata]|uniref:Uncharacterized protein n=1 Tax=Azohydromonas lata TaxID=45677 RepID=A0ABU5IS45_9BURK|nr:hypothetical protein [Azohydromonas lata]MDZ5461726.1 hypothetical protein [Azohydromonas lata]